MNQQIVSWLMYILNELNELSLPYDEQFTNMDDFARWNLPDEIGMGWIAVRDMEIIDNLSKCEVIPEWAIAKLNQIANHFDKAFSFPEEEQSKIFTHEAMRESKFWHEMRNTALEVIPVIYQALQNHSHTEHGSV